jgi:HSF-type DNA-binding
MAFSIRLPFNNDPASLPQSESLADLQLVLDAACRSRPTLERQPASRDSVSAFYPVRSTSIPYSSLGSLEKEKLIAQALDDRLKLARALVVQQAIVQELAKQRYLKMKAALVHELQMLDFEAIRNLSPARLHAPAEKVFSNIAVRSPSPHQSPSSFTKHHLLEHLGSVLRKRSDPLIDCADIKVDEDGESIASTSRGRSKGNSLIAPFPQHLHKKLIQIEKDGDSDVVSFCPHGRAFKVHDMDRFVAEVLPKHFKLNKWTSFRRQLNLYGFLRVRAGPDSTAYYHALFLQSRPDLARFIKRVAVSDGQTDRRRACLKDADESGDDPNFYALPSAYE